MGRVVINKTLILIITFLAAVLSFNVQAENKPVGIAADLMLVTVTHNGQAVEIIRNQGNSNTVMSAFAKTSRPCPPFCMPPMSLAPGVETLRGLEVLDYAFNNVSGRFQHYTR